ncbi:SDR family oxidoreductase [Sphingosinicella sp. LY1275]|uniref:SDR family oxidoreductase n=1 Tax=Sphingosinicella sp. LY1275 TaxID=3095379 RepID=UPI002ADEF3B0|nr:SDR family oxidoreductase [Sphingosinicella sp. LY1275]MEA1014731.1 SDR family oxidoreductase [Sphingosinicella sp. LY1275]
MARKLKPLSEQTIVITGASSGIGLATARMAAQQGAKVVLSARSRDALAQAVDEINQAGPGKASFVTADVGNREELEAVAAHALDRFGGFDTWVNNAGVGIWGTIDQVSDADMRRLFETNFWGVVYGSEVALAHLKAHGGALINIGSVTSDRAMPVQGIYSASKHAVKGFTDALRMELEAENAPVSVTLIKPASIGTPMPQHVKNYSEQEAKFPPPIYAPEEVAATILRAAERPMRDAFIGSAASTLSHFSQQAPRVMDWISEKFLINSQFGPERATPTDNLHHGQSEAQVRGDHQGSLIRPSAYSKAARHPLATLALASLAAAGIGALLSTRWQAEEA